MLSTSEITVVVAVFLAACVEAVEAFTIVLAVGTTRGWRSAFEGTLAALGTLAMLVVVLGPALISLVPLRALRVVVGGLLLIFGLQWLRKAIFRSSGLKALHDEDAIFAKEVATLGALSPRHGGRDSVGFVVSFKGVFLEGLEIVIIVLTLGSSSHQFGAAIIGAIAAVVLVSGVGAIVGRQLSSVPENALKITVAIMLTSFGTFWSGEGLGLRWPGSDLFILALIALYGSFVYIAVQVLTRRGPSRQNATGF